MSKAHTTWLSLFTRLGKQPVSRTENKPIIIKCNDNYYKGKIVFTHNGSKFYLETTEEANDWLTKY